MGSGATRLAAALPAAVSIHEGAGVCRRSLGGQQAFQFAMADYQTHHLRASRIEETRAQGHIVAKIVDADANPSSEMESAIASGGKAGVSGALPRRKIGIRGIRRIKV